MGKKGNFLKKELRRKFEEVFGSEALFSLESKTSYEEIRFDFMEYALCGIPPEDEYTQAILKGDLRKAVKLCSYGNELEDHVKAVFSSLPDEIWGSPENYERHLSLRVTTDLEKEFIYLIDFDAYKELKELDFDTEDLFSFIRHALHGTRLNYRIEPIMDDNYLTDPFYHGGKKFSRIRGILARIKGKINTYEACKMRKTSDPA